MCSPEKLDTKRHLNFVFPGLMNILSNSCMIEIGLDGNLSHSSLLCLNVLNIRKIQGSKNYIQSAKEAFFQYQLKSVSSSKSFWNILNSVTSSCCLKVTPFVVCEELSNKLLQDYCRCYWHSWNPL